MIFIRVQLTVSHLTEILVSFKWLGSVGLHEIEGAHGGLANVKQRERISDRAGVELSLSYCTCGWDERQKHYCHLVEKVGIFSWRSALSLKDQTNHFRKVKLQLKTSRVVC